MEHFKDRIAIVTGGASGMGRALCEELGRRGAVVIATDINNEGVKKVASAITGTGGQAAAAYLDVTQVEDVQKLIEKTALEYGRLDYMFNNAGIAIAGEERDVSLEHWRRVIGVNIWGVIYGTTAAYSLMVKQGFGHIVNTASLAGLIPVPNEISYTTAKHAVVGLSTSLRAEGADLGVKVSVVCPGFVQTGIFDATPVLQANMEDLLAKIPFKMIEATKAARLILRGVTRNRAIIIFPPHARIFWWLNRLHPALNAPFGRKMVRDFRAIRTEP